MDIEDDDFRRLDAERDARQRDEDFRAELSGVASGRMSRFLPDDHSSKPGARERRAEKARAQMTALEALLANDPVYRAAYEGAVNTLRDAETNTETAMTAAQAALIKDNADLADMRQHGSVLPDGRKVYRDAHGNARTEEGDKIEGAMLEGVVWREDAPTYEQLRAKRESADRLEAHIHALRTYQTDVLGHARDRLEDMNNPPSIDELTEIQDRIETEMPRLDTSVAPAADPSSDRPAHDSGAVQLPKL